MECPDMYYFFWYDFLKFKNRVFANSLILKILTIYFVIGDTMLSHGYMLL